MQKKVKFDEAVRTKYPEQVVIVIAKDKRGRSNPVTLGWTMIASYDPPMMAISLYRGHYSVGCIRSSRSFTLAYPSADQAKAALFFGSHSGRDMDKFKAFKCKTEPAKKINSLLLTDAVANFECRLIRRTAAGDHIIFLGRVVCAHKNTKHKKRLYTIGPGHKLGAV